ncbi:MULTISPECIES: hypothetical protein [Stenotrophomonas]|uniref:hypothetical protein n=1 Tax=Stenotrophomonas TaxID=40323 RepID=UPI000A6B2275|nr:MULTISPECIES: hypothetical protein [Stenotrophomonas]
MSTQGANPLVAQVKKDFSAYWGTAEKGRLEDLPKQRTLLVSAYKYAVCFGSLSRAMTQLGEHQRIFFQELSSDTLHLVHALINGDARGARFYLRSVVENFWRHHYFRDHPIEYGWLTSRQKYYVEMKSLREHCLWLDCFKQGNEAWLGSLSKLYADLSTSVHSTSSKTLVLRDALEDIKLANAQSDAVSKDMHAVLKACLALTIYSERAIFQGLHVNVQHFLLSVLNKKHKTWLDEKLTNE